MDTATLEPQAKTTAPEPEAPEAEVSDTIKDAFLSVMAGKLDPIRKPAEVTKEPAKPDEKAKATKAPDAAPETVAEPAKPKVRRKERTEAETTEIVARAAATATAEVLSRQPKPEVEKQTAPKPLSEQVPAKYRKKLEAFQEMANAQPDRYGSLVPDFVAAIKSVDAYKATWEQEHPGTKFNPDDDAHNEFFEQNEPDYDEDDYADARTAISQKPLEAKARKVDDLEKQLKELQGAEEARKLAPAVEAIRREAAKQVLDELDPEFAKVINDNEAFEKHLQADPLAAEIAVGAAQHAAQLVSEAVRIMDGKVPVDWDAPATRTFVEVKNAIEADIKARPVDEQYDDAGRRFATWTEYNAIVQHRPEAADKYWFLDREKLTWAIPKKIANHAREMIKKETARFETIAQARGFTANPASNGAHKATAGKPKEPAKPPVNPPIASPAAAGGKTTVDTLAKPTPGDKPLWENKFLSVMGGKLS